MRRILSPLAFALAFTCVAQAVEIQGVVADWNCVKGMVQDGREKTLKQNRGCSLMKKYKRQGYGLITDSKKFYKLEDPGNQHIIELLGNSHDKDNLKVIVRGDLQGNTIKVGNITIL